MRADAFYVRISKKLTVPEKRAAIAASRAEFEVARQANPGLNDADLETLLIKERIAQMAPLGKWQDKWLSHPFPNMSEPEKAVCYLTDYHDYEEDHLARLYNKASLHSTASITSSCRSGGVCHCWNDLLAQPAVGGGLGMGTVLTTRNR